MNDFFFLPDAHLYTTFAQYLLRSEEGIIFHGTAVTDGYEPLCGAGN